MKYQISQACSLSPSSMRGANSSEVSCWLALRAGVLRRAASQSETAQERRAEFNASAVSPGSRGASPKTKVSVAACVPSGNSHMSTSGILPNSHENYLLFASLAGPMVHACHMGSFSLISAG